MLFVPEAPAYPLDGEALSTNVVAPPFVRLIVGVFARFGMLWSATASPSVKFHVICACAVITAAAIEQSVRASFFIGGDSNLNGTDFARPRSEGQYFFRAFP